MDVFHSFSCLARDLLSSEQDYRLEIIGRIFDLEGALNSSSINSLRAGNSAVDMLRAATRLPLRDEHGAYAQISDAIHSAESAEPACVGIDLEYWVYSLALIYSHQTGLMPAFSNCENETRFERFVLAVPAPSRCQLTRNRLKAAIRRLNLKNNPGFARDLDLLNNKLQF